MFTSRLQLRGLGDETEPPSHYILSQGWREVIEAVFSEEADMRRQMVRFREGSGGADREKKVREISTGPAPVQASFFPNLDQAEGRPRQGRYVEGGGR